MHLSANEIKEVVRTEELKKYYPLGTHTVKALDGVNLIVKEGEFVAITGKSGSGKSTLLHMLGALDVPTSGEVYIDGKSLASMTREEQAPPHDSPQRGGTFRLRPSDRPVRFP
mgnify:CR=1 FL=1